MTSPRAEIVYKDLSYRIVGLAMEVHRKLGYGFLENVYEKALMVLFARDGISARRQVPISVHFEGQNVGYYVADIVVDRLVIIEVKSAEALCDAHRAQTLNYLKATGMRLGILLNFGKSKLEFERLLN